ncbi:ABC transporter ATP-binding protein [Arvimicrobium flavum]|uniref:ABC transporter ATP-binding protein n=1 Tax=Arvimicrobium flavum TaxID=3393320 RepID=UPI00237ACA6C|nr:ABC transporter ATP-binding protein [Mesorhizobium shangrilense]
MLQIRNLEKHYPSSSSRPVMKAIDTISFDVAKGDFFTLLGPSGCGKTTTLQCIAGLEQPTGGEILMGGDVVYSSASRTIVAPNRRNLGMIFQSYAIWPHKTVFENVAFPLVHGQQRVGREEVRRRVMDALDLVKLADLADRPSPFLSGGQQQRVALARAVVHRPRLLLLDEPLSNLDAKLRDEMRVELRRLVKELGITTIFVTHDQIEAMAMSDQIVLMRSGKIVQRGTPRELYLSPRDAFTAAFMGRSNLVPAEIVAGANGRIVRSPLGEFECEIDPALLPGHSAYLVFRQQAAELLGPQSMPAANTFSCKVREVHFLGDNVELDVTTNGVDYRLLLDPYGEFLPGQDLCLRIPGERLVVVPREDGAGR